MEILINQILDRATDIHSVDLKTRRTESVSSEVEFTLTMSGRMPVRLFDEVDEEEDEAPVKGLTFLNGAST